MLRDPTTGQPVPPQLGDIVVRHSTHFAQPHKEYLVVSIDSSHVGLLWAGPIPDQRSYARRDQVSVVARGVAVPEPLGPQRLAPAVGDIVHRYGEPFTTPHRDWQVVAIEGNRARLRWMGPTPERPPKSEHVDLDMLYVIRRDPPTPTMRR